MTFNTQADFIKWLKVQPEENISFSFKPDSRYPITLYVERKPNRLIITEVTEHAG